MANTDNPNGFKAVNGLGGTIPPRIKPYKVAASQTIAKGDWVILNAAGDVNIALSNSAALLGVAAHAVTTTAADEQTELLVYVADKITEFEGQCSGTFSAALRGDFVDIEGATGVMEVNENAGATKVIQLLAENEDTEIGANSRVTVQVVLSQYKGTEVA